MKLLARATVTGVTQFAGVIDGEKIDANNVFLLVDIAKSAGSGMRTAPRKTSGAEVIAALLATNVTFPAECDLEFVMEATKGNESMVITAVRPVVKAPQQRQAA